MDFVNVNALFNLRVEKLEIFIISGTLKLPTHFCLQTKVKSMYFSISLFLAVFVAKLCWTLLGPYGL